MAGRGWCSAAAEAETFKRRLGRGVVLGGDWKEITSDSGLRFRSPVELTPVAARGIDSNVNLWEGKNLTVMMDEGPFADPLTSYANRPNARVFEETVAGRPARVVSFQLDDGRDFAAVHLDLGGPGPGGRRLTISVTGREEFGGEVPLEIAKSVEPISP
jgi:hypothetical protein